MSKATTSIIPSPQTFNVEKKYHELGLRNFVRSHSIPLLSPHHANFEFWGNGGLQKVLATYHTQIIRLRTFVRQQSCHKGLAWTAATSCAHYDESDMRDVCMEM